MQGFQAGQVNLKKEASPELAKLANPYDPAANSAYTRGVGDMSYYQGKLFLYFGVTPVLVLLWPYAALTGQYLSDQTAMIIFCSLGALTAALLLDALRLRYFPKTGVWVVTAGVLCLGLAIGSLLVERGDTEVYQVSASCGFAFAMLALAGIWQAMHDTKRKVRWLLLASLAYGFAVGARPSVLFGAIILLIPVVEAWPGGGESNPRRQTAWLLAVAIGPIFLIGLAMMRYNHLRFGSPFEFGWHYEFNADRGKNVGLLSPRFSGFDFIYYFWQPMSWSGYFPFLQMSKPLSPPLGFGSAGRSYGGILFIIPLVWLALAAPLAWRGRAPGEARVLRWFAAALALLFVICAATDCLFSSAYVRYELDFLPALVLLSILGMLGLRRALANSTGWKRVARWSCCLLPAGSTLFCVLASVEGHAESDYYAGGFFTNHKEEDKAMKYYQSAVALEPGSAWFQSGMGIAYENSDQLDLAAKQYRQALRMDPHDSRLEILMGGCYWRMGRSSEAFTHLQRAFEIQPDFAATSDRTTQLNRFAWVLATDPDPTRRNGALAVKLAEGVCQKTQYKNTVFVGTLAAAYAEAGQFDDAILTQQKTIALFKQNGATNMLPFSQELMALFLEHQPYHRVNAEQGN